MFKNKQETSPDVDSGEFRSRAETDTKAPRSRSKRAEGAKKNQAEDPLLPEKKRARRRLIGAVALVLAAVIGLPMVLDSEPKPLADDISIQIPSKDKPLSGAAAAKENSDALAAASAEQQAPRTGGKAAVASANGNSGSNKSSRTVQPLEPQEEIIDPATLGGSKGKTTAPAPAVKAPTEKTVAHADKDVKPAATPKTSEKSTTVASEPKPVSAKPAAKPDSGDDAARAMAILEGKSPGKSADAAKSDKPSHFIVQVAALASQDKVDDLQGKLKSSGIKSYTQKVATSSGDKIRVIVGPFDSKEDADKMHAKLAKLGLNGTVRN